LLRAATNALTPGDFSIGQPTEKDRLADLRRLTRARRPTDFAEFEAPIRAELFSAERFEQHAQSWRSRKRSPRIRRSIVRWSRACSKTDAYCTKLTSSSAMRATADRNHAGAEWLLDNFHVVEDQLRDIREHLPASYYKLLPKLAEGPLRVTHACMALRGDRRPHRQPLRPGLADPLCTRLPARTALTIGELWACRFRCAS